MSYDPATNMIGGFTDNDGTIDFYLRINSLLSKEQTVLDLGAGRAAWYEDDECPTRRSIRMLKGKVKKVIASDVDPVVLENRASDEQILMSDGDLNVSDSSVDLIVADYVLEHIDDPEKFVQQINACLKSGGWFCARTPHKYSYVSIAASLVKNIAHTKVLKIVQPNRKEIDVFPTKYKMNTMGDINKYFPNWHNSTFIFRSDPAYFFGNKFMYKFQAVMHRVLFKVVSGNLFIFVQKP